MQVSSLEAYVEDAEEAIENARSLLDRLSEEDLAEELALPSLFTIAAAAAAAAATAAAAAAAASTSVQEV